VRCDPRNRVARRDLRQAAHDPQLDWDTAVSLAVAAERRQNGTVSLTIRYAVMSDMAELRGIFRRASLSNENDREHLVANPESLVLAEDGVRERRTRVALDTKGSIIGFASYLISGNVAELDDLFVDPPWMRHGVGRDLVVDISSLVLELHFESLEVTANPHAMAFYEHMGFVAERLVDTEFYPAARMHRRTN
jgi:GNAT superfamily N-acetyltransferase